MAYAVTTYYCDTCELGYPKQGEAENCERKHYKAISIKSCKYDGLKRTYPDSINVLCQNSEGGSTTITYYRIGAK